MITGMSLIGIRALWLLNLVRLLMRANASLSTLYWLPKLYKGPYKSHFIANSSSCTTNELSIPLTSCLTVIKTFYKMLYDSL